MLAAGITSQGMAFTPFMQETESPSSSHPYRTSDQASDLLELTATLAAKERELDRLRAWKRRSRIGVTIALVVAMVHVAAFSGIFVLRYVPKVEAATTCPDALAAAAPAPINFTETLQDTGCGEGDACPKTTALDELGGEDKIPALASEVTRALYSDPTLARSPRFLAIGRERADTLVRQQLQSLLGASRPVDAEEGFEVAWELRPTHAEWTAVTEVVMATLQEHQVDTANLEQLRSQLETAGIQATDDIPKRRNALHARASVGLECPEAKISSTPLEISFNRVVRGCGKSAIYFQPDPESGPTSPWKREETP